MSFFNDPTGILVLLKKNLLFSLLLSSVLITFIDDLHSKELTKVYTKTKIEKAVKQHLSEMFKRDKYIVKWEYPEIEYYTYLYESPKTNYRVPIRLSDKIENHFKTISKLTRIKIKKSVVNPNKNEAVIYLLFTNDFYRIAQTDQNIKRIFFNYRKKEYSSFLEDLKRKKQLHIGTLGYSSLKVRTYLYFQDLREKAIAPFVSTFKCFISSQHSDIIQPSLTNRVKLINKYEIFPFDKILLEEFYQPSIYHGMPVPLAIKILTKSITGRLLKVKPDIRFHN